ncbi:DUF2059 domain-containing protein [Pseudomonas lalucatii]|uniref:DUF2059 domain-containing protein n=1 Tax=Pseudomonas lalucatii TaxID=1424203 RepID=A0ABS5PWN7_9PSED|nr:DUF2059 domain-containing protein [Pseudomonas lalucatii]MBS7660911.1 DUF2059 domain-containing protein [Pseudomonas lalucatii]
MSRLTALCATLLLACGSVQAFADAASHAADAERFLQLARADRLTVPVYGQVQQMFAQRFAESGAPAGQQALLERYQAKANAALDRAVGWPVLKPALVELYTTHFDEREMQELLAFYRSPLGQKVLEKMPMLTAQSARLTQNKLEAAVPRVNELLAEMSGKLDAKKP